MTSEHSLIVVSCTCRAFTPLRITLDGVKGSIKAAKRRAADASPLKAKPAHAPIPGFRLKCLAV